MHKPFSESVPTQFTESPFTPALSQSSPQHAQLGFVSLASHPHVHKPKPNAAHRTTAISLPPLTAPSPSPRSAGGSHGHGSKHQHERYVNVHGIDSGSGLGSGGRVQLAESPQIRAEALIPLMALDVLEHAGRCMHIVHRCECTRVFHPLYE